MTHLTSLIAKAKAYQTHCDPVDQNRIDAMDAYFDARAAFGEAATPHLILALCELAMAAEGVDQLDLMHDSEILVDRAKAELRAKLAAVRGVGA